MTMLTVEQYHAMIEAGILTDNDPVELLEGVLVLKSPKTPQHVYAAETAQDVIRRLLPQGWSYQPQVPITMNDGEPEPDGAVIRGTFRDYRAHHPFPADATLII